MADQAHHDQLTAADLDALRALDTPTISNCLERLPIRPWTEGFMRPEIRSIMPRQKTVVGYAVTVTMSAVRQSDKPVSRRAYWEAILAIPAPRLIVVHDRDYPNPIGSYWGEVQGNIARALGAVGAITDGGVRDLKEAEEIGFPFWAKEVLVSHAYVHPESVNEPIDVGGIAVRPGDLLAADMHGVINIPFEAATRIPKIAKLEAESEGYIIDLCQSGIEVTPDLLDEASVKRAAVFDSPGAAY
ncbi:MAG: RraA family protein [Chloroflexi bacterium]|nr:RraA family protein [Chloroflexota bacterium]MCH8102281.1 RraA family protein [Chloroflexota bacterium]